MNKICINDMEKDATTNNFFLNYRRKATCILCRQSNEPRLRSSISNTLNFFLFLSDKGEMSTSG